MKRLRLELLVGALVVFAVMPMVFLGVLDFGGDEVATPNCQEVRAPRSGTWQASGFAARNDIVTELSFCEVLQGRSRSEVAALLGPPGAQRPGELQYDLPPGGAGPRSFWLLLLDGDGRIAGTRYVIADGL